MPHIAYRSLKGLRSIRTAYRSPQGLRFPSDVPSECQKATTLMDDAVIRQPFLSLADEYDPVSHVGIYDTALLSESQATSLRSLLSNFGNIGTIN